MGNQRLIFSIFATTLGLMLLGGAFTGSAPIAFADDDDDRKKRLIELISKIRSHLEDEDDKCPEEKKYEGACDKKSPKIEIKEPENKDKLPAGEIVKFELKAKDKGSGLAKVELRINDGAFQDATLISGDNWEFTTNLEPGKYKATAKATDNVGNMKRDNVKFTVVDLEEEEEEEEENDE